MRAPSPRFAGFGTGQPLVAAAITSHPPSGSFIVSATPTATDLDQLVREYRNDHPKSAELHTTALDFFAARGATHFARVQVPFRPYITHARGTRKWDVDGREYID